MENPLEKTVKEEKYVYYDNRNLFEKIKGSYQHWKYYFKLGNEDLIQRFKYIKKGIKEIIEKRH